MLAADNGNLQPLKDLHIATQTPVYKCSGWCIPFAEYMRRFWVKTKYYGIIEMYALNKTDIRKELKSNIIEIMEVKKELIILCILIFPFVVLADLLKMNK